jgi:hypothetical protein
VRARSGPGTWINVEPKTTTSKVSSSKGKRRASASQKVTLVRAAASSRLAEQGGRYIDPTTARTFDPRASARVSTPVPQPTSSTRASAGKRMSARKAWRISCWRVLGGTEHRKRSACNRTRKGT